MLVKDDVVRDIHASQVNLQFSITLTVLKSLMCGMMLHTNAVSSRHCFVDLVLCILRNGIFIYYLDFKHARNDLLFIYL
jgi:hypothetical protein